MSDVFSLNWLGDALFITHAVILGFIIHALVFYLACDEQYYSHKTQDQVFYLMASTGFFTPYYMGMSALLYVTNQ